MRPSSRRSRTIHGIEAFSESLLRLHELADRVPSRQFLAEALSQLRSLIAFDACWWGECSPPLVDTPPANWQHGSLGLPASFAEEWNAVGAVDDFARSSMAAPGSVCRVSGYEDDLPDVASFGRRHDLFHVMAITLDLPESGLMFFVCLYRCERGRAFDDDEAAQFGQYGRHLRLHWTTRVRDAMRRVFAGDALGLALCEASGRLLYLGAGMASLIVRHCPGWQGTMLPEPLLALARRAPASVALGRRTVIATLHADVVTLSTGGSRVENRLSPREREAAVLYATGESYKEIARRLALTPATVRTYLRDVYARLDVRNKVELGVLLGIDRQRADP
jgi:DNA-binding CsgD family transcriptional regulator